MSAFLALAAIGAVLGLILAVASKKLYVEEDKRLEVVVDMLPGYNCGACSHPGCNGMAEAILAEETKLSACKPGKKDDLLKIKDYLEAEPGPDGETIKVEY